MPNGRASSSVDANGRENLCVNAGESNSIDTFMCA
jgi:hypothetical protein